MTTSRIRSLALAIALAGTMATTTMTAQAPRQISYQGVISTVGGSPVADGNHTVVLKIYNGGGTELFSETHNTTTVKGLFNILIGSVTPLPGALTFNEPYFLGITVDGGSEMSPRTPMASVPYALNGTTINGASGAVTLQGGGGTTINRVGNTITISSAGGGGGTGIQGVQSSDGSLVVANPNGPTADIGIADGAISSSKLAANAVTSGKIASGAVTNDKLANGAVTSAKISGTGASAGQVLSYDGTNVVWASAGGGLTLPYAGNYAGASDAFAVTTTGTGRAGAYTVNNAASLSGALEGTNNSTANGGGALVGASGLLGRITPTAPGTYSAGVRGINNGTGGNGIGVAGYQAGSGWGVYGETPTGVGVFGNVTGATGSGIEAFSTGAGTFGLHSASNLGTPGSFQTTNPANTKNALEATQIGTGRGLFVSLTNATNAAAGIEATTSGTGRAGLFTQTNTGNTAIALEATNASTQSGSGPAAGPSAIVGRLTAGTAGGYSAAIRGVVTGTGSTGIGVVGYHQNGGWGVYGESGTTGRGVYGYAPGTNAEGVRGEAGGASSYGVNAVYSGAGTGTALNIENGAIKVSGSTKPIFAHIATPANTTGHITTIDNALINGDPNAMVIITHVYGPGASAIYDTKVASIWYDSSINKWRIYHDDLTAIAANTKWNVLVFKQ